MPLVEVRSSITGWFVRAVEHGEVHVEVVHGLVRPDVDLDRQRIVAEHGTVPGAGRADQLHGRDLGLAASPPPR